MKIVAELELSRGELSTMCESLAAMVDYLDQNRLSTERETALLKKARLLLESTDRLAADRQQQIARLTGNRHAKDVHAEAWYAGQNAKALASPPRLEWFAGSNIHKLRELHGS